MREAAEREWAAAQEAQAQADMAAQAQTDTILHRFYEQKRYEAAQQSWNIAEEVGAQTQAAMGSYYQQKIREIAEQTWKAAGEAYAQRAAAERERERLLEEAQSTAHSAAVAHVRAELGMEARERLAHMQQQQVSPFSPSGFVQYNFQFEFALKDLDWYKIGGPWICSFCGCALKCFTLQSSSFGNASACVRCVNTLLAYSRGSFDANGTRPLAFLTASSVAVTNKRTYNSSVVSRGRTSNKRNKQRRWNPW